MIEALTNLDLAVLSAVNGLARVFGPVDDLVTLIAKSTLIKGLPVMMLFWGLWFLPGSDRRRRWSALVAVLLISMVALFVGRMLAITLPFRLRPIHSETVDVTLPYGMSEGTLDGWSSMPSDHAVMYFSMAMGLFLVHRLAGSLAFLHALVVVSLPRVYLGLHFPSDILVGGLVGGLTMLLLLPPLARALDGLDLARIEGRHPQIWYPALFFLTFQWGTMFNPALDAARAVMVIGVAALT